MIDTVDYERNWWVCDHCPEHPCRRDIGDCGYADYRLPDYVRRQIEQAKAEIEMQRLEDEAERLRAQQEFKQDRIYSRKRLRRGEPW